MILVFCQSPLCDTIKMMFRQLNKKLNLLPLSFALITIPCTDSAGIGECVSGLYNWSLAIVGIVAFVQIIYAGWLYLSAAGNTSKTGDAMKKISNAVLGIVLLFSSYLILNTINPDLVGESFGLPDLKKDKIEDIDYSGTSTTSNTTTTILQSSTTTLASGTTTTINPNTPDWSSITPATPLAVSFRDYIQLDDILGHIGPGTDAEVCLVGSGFAPGMGLYVSGLGTFLITPHTTTKATLHLNASDNRFAPGWQNITHSGGEVAYFQRGEYTTDFILIYLDLENGLGTVRPQKPCNN